MKCGVAYSAGGILLPSDSYFEYMFSFPPSRQHFVFITSLYLTPTPAFQIDLCVGSLHQLAVTAEEKMIHLIDVLGFLSSTTPTIQVGTLGYHGYHAAGPLTNREIERERYTERNISGLHDISCRGGITHRI